MNIEQEIQKLKSLRGQVNGRCLEAKHHAIEVLGSQPRGSYKFVVNLLNNRIKSLEQQVSQS